MYQDVFGHVSNGVNLVSYWHWSSLHGGQETYWKGVLGHDLEPNRAYREVSRVGADLKRIGTRLFDLKRSNEVALLYSVDSFAAMGFMPYDKDAKARKGFHADGYPHRLEQSHTMLLGTTVHRQEHCPAQAPGADA
jgi:beta-galactosidase